MGYKKAVSMELPKGMCCADCYHYRKCKELFGCHHANTDCDFSPSRFHRDAGIEDYRQALIAELKNYKPPPVPEGELKPCPFCGGTDIGHDNSDTHPYEWLMCEDCGAKMHGRIGTGKVFEKWNRRA